MFNTKPRPPVNVLHALLAIGLAERDANTSGESWRLTELGLGVRAALEPDGGASSRVQMGGTSRDERLLTPERCRAVREMLQWSTEDLARYAQVGKGTIDRFEMRMGNPHPRTLKAILAAFRAAGSEFAKDASL
ncbi:helix-turn-helix domain-containing protein [Muricoccus aerilatus]|uniref:helix-turn-helix domain-containing protein n=1 Tax=Muricoccus aerilatus TaxID=452982 RepID=UPI0012EB64CA|nr:helix-turn-helix transcriptional regulator [Roseomonas aerilata]